MKLVEPTGVVPCVVLIVSVEVWSVNGFVLVTEEGLKEATVPAGSAVVTLRAAVHG